MTNLFKKPGDIEFHRDRKLSVFPPQIDTTIAEYTTIDPKPVYTDVRALIDRAKEVKEDLQEVAEAFSIPISEEDADVRAAHAQLGGDGISIKFQEYMAAIEEHQDRRGDYLNEDFTGLGSGDMAKIRKNRYNRAIKKNAGGDLFGLSGIFDKLSEYGSNAVLLWLLGEQIAMYTSADTQQSVSGKYPPATEVGSVLAQIVQALSMLQMVTGMTEDAIDEYQNMEIIPDEIDFNSALKSFKMADPPRSRAWGFYRAQMASANHELLLNYSVNYCVQHIGEGFESWLGYLTARSTQEDGLRSYYDGESYRTGEQELGAAHRDALTTKSTGGQALLDAVALGLGRGMNHGETCCLLRFLDMFTPNVLEIMRSIIQMSIASMTWEAQKSYKWFLDLANHPWSVISEKLVAELDKYFEKVVAELLNVMEMDNTTFMVLRECTPIDELFDFVLSALVEIKSWYHNLIKSMNIAVDKTFRGMMFGWQTTFKIRRAKEILMAIDELLEQAELIGELREDDNLISGLVGKLEGMMWKHDVDGDLGNKSAAANGIDTAIEWCRKIGDWDYIGSLFQEKQKQAGTT